MIKKIIRHFLGIRESEWALRIERDNRRFEIILTELMTVQSSGIDIGSHDGMFLDFFLKIAPQGKHFAFEPLPDYFERLRYKYPTVISFNYALSNQEGEAIFFCPVSAKAMSGLKKQHYPVETEVKEINVMVKRLDDVIPDTAEVNLIKIDVEGAELLTLQGAVKTIERCSPAIIFEFALLHSLEYNISAQSIFDFFDERSYSIHSLDRKKTYTVESFNAIAETSHASGYDRNAETNFLAIPKKLNKG